MKKEFNYLLGLFLFLFLCACGKKEAGGLPECSSAYGYTGNFVLRDGKCYCPEGNYYLDDGANKDCIPKGEYVYRVEADTNHCMNPSLHCFPAFGKISRGEYGDRFILPPGVCLEPRKVKYEKLPDGSVEISFEIDPFSLPDDCGVFRHLSDCWDVQGFAYGRSNPENTSMDIEITYYEECTDTELGKGYLYLRK